ncbi:restriction endonuclease subunit S [Streptomyces sp. NPDC020571]|uniref:restriction endonuclease subunit S n=1 Tax=Streptomyces sp. NPDC020571 TaxID=3365079 RepID=UPI0037A21DAA
MGFSAWRTLPLGGIVALQRGFDLANDRRSPGEVPVVGASGVVGWHDVAMVSGPGVTLGRAGAMGKATYVSRDYWPLNTTLFVTDFLGNDPQFIYYLLHNMDFTPYNSGGVQPMLNRNYIKDLPVVIPELSEQQAIAEVLGALDDKIALNDQVREVALCLGRSLLDREVQEAGVVVQLRDVADLVYGKALPLPSRREGNVPVFGCTGQVGWHDAPLTDRSYPVIGRKGANAGRVSWMSQPGWVIDTAFYARPVWARLKSEALYFILDAAGIGALIADSAVPGVNRNAALDHKMLMPSPARMEQFARQASTLLASREHAANENRTLADLRDTLLPQLLSGKLRVKDAVRTVEEVV